MRNREDKKCKKRQESTIGKIIYGFLLFMPLFAIGVTCGYAIFNKNAYESFAGQENNTITYQTITNYSDVNSNKRIKFTSGNYNYTGNVPIGAYALVWEITDLTNINTNYTNYDITNFDRFALYIDSYSNLSIQLYLGNNSLGNSISFATNYFLDFEFTYVNSGINTAYFINTNCFSYKIYTANNTLDNVFYYSVDKVTESPLFSWAENSIIYTTTANTCNALSITTPFIPLLLAYWLIISVIYFLYDIALMLVWIIHHKIHEMQESI